jgi:hypothetical protein
MKRHGVLSYSWYRNRGKRLIYRPPRHRQQQAKYVMICVMISGRRSFKKSRSELIRRSQRRCGMRTDRVGLICPAPPCIAFILLPSSPLHHSFCNSSPFDLYPPLFLPHIISQSRNVQLFSSTCSFRCFVSRAEFESCIPSKLGGATRPISDST